MEGRLLHRHRKLVRRIVSSGEFSDDIRIKSRNGLEFFNIKGWVTKHWLSFDESNRAVESKNAHINISELDLLELGYPVRNDKGEVDLHRDFVSVKDSNGDFKDFIILNHFPDETNGLIVCILGEYKDDAYDPY